MSELTIYGHYLGHELYLRPSTEQPGSLEVTADVGDQETTVALHPEAVRKLRLALQLFEKTGQVTR